MRRIILLTLGSALLLMPGLPAVAQDVTIGPGGVTIEHHRHYNQEEWERRQAWRERQMQRQEWRQRFYERHGYWPEED